MYAKILSAGVLGVEAFQVDVEIDIYNKSLPSWNTVGLPESAVKESKERVISAIRNSELDFVYRKVVINLAPADLKKVGTAYDLPIAIGLLAASNLLDEQEISKSLFIGELSLIGQVKPVKGVFPISILAKELNLKRIYVPKENAFELLIDLFFLSS